MTEGHSGGVLIGDHRSYVKLSRIASRDENGMTSVLIEVKGGPFVGEVRDDTLYGVAEFCEALTPLYESLSGEAKLSSYEKFGLTMSGDGRGAIAISVELYGEHVPLSKLRFEFELDQTFLPAIIAQLRAEFPDG